MRKETKIACMIRDVLEERMATLRSGQPFDFGAEAQQLRAVIGMLTAIGLVEDADWRLSDLDLAARGARIVGSRRELELSIIKRLCDPKRQLHPIVIRTVKSLVGYIASLVIEMTAHAYAYDLLVDGLSRTADHPRQQRRRTVRYGLRMSDSSLHADPHGFLTDARTRLDDAKQDVARALRRIAYLKEADASRQKRQLSPPASLHDPARLVMASNASGAVGALHSQAPLQPNTHPPGE